MHSSLYFLFTAFLVCLVLEIFFDIPALSIVRDKVKSFFKDVDKNGKSKKE